MTAPLHQGQLSIQSFDSGSDTQHSGRDLQRRHRGSVFVEAHPEEAVHRRRQEVAHSSRLEGRD